MLRYIFRILVAIIERGTQECQELAEILLRELYDIPFGVIHQELDAISFLEELAGNTSLANQITKSMKNIGRIYSINKAECFACGKTENMNGLQDYSDEEAYEAHSAYLDYLDKQLALKENNYNLKY